MNAATNEIVFFVFGSLPYNHCRIGGQWKRMIVARRIQPGTKIKIGAPIAGNNMIVYFTVIRV